MTLFPSTLGAEQAIEQAPASDRVCAGCGRPIGAGPTLKLADEAIIHFTSYDCLIQYGNLRETLSKPQRPAKANVVPADEECAADETTVEHEVPAVTEQAALEDRAWFAPIIRPVRSEPAPAMTAFG